RELEPRQEIRCPSCATVVVEGDPRYNRPDGSYHPACHDGLRPGPEATIWRDLEETARLIEMAVAALRTIPRPAPAPELDRDIARGEPGESAKVSHQDNGAVPSPAMSAAPPSAPLAQRLIALPGEPWTEGLRLSAS